MADRFDYSDAPELVRRFLNYKSGVQNRSKMTVYNYYHDLLTFSRFLLKTKRAEKYQTIANEEIPFSDADDDLLLHVTNDDIFEFMSFAASTLENQARSRARKLSCLRSFYKYLIVTIKVMENDPTKNIEAAKKETRLPKFLSLEESKTLLASVDGKYAERDFAIITLFLNCGLRVSELCGIDLNDISTDLSTLTVIGKGNKERRVYLNDACRDALRAYKKVRLKDVKEADKNALFISRNRNRISVQTVQWLIYKHLNEAGLGHLGMSVHKLRHTAATLMYNYGGTDVRVLKDILGHEELSTTQIYTHVSPQKLADAANSNPLAAGVKRVGLPKVTDASDDDET